MGTFLVVQWLRLDASTAGGRGSIPGQGTNIPHALGHGQKKTKKDGSISLYSEIPTKAPQNKRHLDLCLQG